MSNKELYDVAVIGAGVFGAWTAWHLAKRGQRVVLLDAYGVAHSRASSGGESRIIRMSYGPQELYTRWSVRSLKQWQELFLATGQKLFVPTGVLWLAGEDDTQLNESQKVLERWEIAHEVLEPNALETRYPQLSFAGVKRGVLEPESGVLLARRAVACVVEDAIRWGADFRIAEVSPPGSGEQLDFVATSRGERVAAKRFVFACGAWLGKVFPGLLGQRIFPTRQEIFFFSTPPGDVRFAAPALPTWLFQADDVYGMPDIENRGLKVARDAHGERVDPDFNSRLPSKEGAEFAKEFVGRRFPALKDTEITETRVCQYENTSNGDFLLDRHPDFQNVWLAGGGSGHGFKHGPAVGEYMAGQILGGYPAEPRFNFASKNTAQERMVF